MKQSARAAIAIFNTPLAEAIYWRAMGSAKLAACSAVAAIALACVSTRWAVASAAQHDPNGKSHNDKKSGPLNGFYIVTLAVAAAPDANAAPASSTAAQSN